MRAELKVLQSFLYHADLDGHIYSLHGGKVKRIKPIPKPAGYLKFNAYLLPGIYTIHVHSFVWVYYKGPVPKGYQVNHKNFDRSDNRLSNLELLTPLENVRYSVRAGRFDWDRSHTIGETNGRAKLTCDQVLAIRSRAEKDSVLAAEYGVGRTTIREIRSHKRWSHL